MRRLSTQLAWIKNWKLEYVEGSWNASVRNLYDGKIDLLLPAQKTKDRIGKMSFSEYIGGYQPIGLYARKDDDLYYNDYQNLDHKKVACSAGSSNEKAVDEFASANGITLDVLEYDTTEEKIEALKEGRVDLIAFSTFNDVPDAKVVAILEYLPFYFCTRIEDKDLSQELNDGMRQVMADYPEMAGKLYVNAIESSENDTFTREEHDKINETKELAVGVYQDSFPMSGIDENGNCIGIYADLLHEVEKESGIPIRIVPVERKDNIYERLENGEFDFVLSSRNLVRTAPDTSKILVSNAIMEYVTVAVTSSDYQFNEAQDPVFALTSSRTYWKDYITEHYPDASILYCKSAKECMLAVQRGSADVTLINSWEYNYHSKNVRFEDLIEWESVRISSDLVAATTSSVDPLLLSIIDKSFGQISKTKKDEIVASNVNMRYISYDTGDRIYAIRGTMWIILGTLVFFMTAVLMYLYMRRKNNAELRTKNQELEAANKAKSEFLSRMSHELRTPLNAMMGYTVLIRQNIMEENIDKSVLLQNLTYTERAAKYLLGIISDILDMQNIERGKIQIRPEEINPENYMMNVLEVIEKEAKEKGIHFEYRRMNRIDGNIMLDGVRFQQVLLNILHNAIKFTPSKGTIHMTSGMIEQSGEDVTLEFQIADTGIGMSREFMEKSLFKQFAQENQDLTSPYEGCGTGLVISKHLIEQMGGTIVCESEKGIGTTFTITIRTKRVRKTRGERRRTQNTSFDLSGIRVLICEDNPMNQDMEKKILERMKCEVVIAEDGKIGLERFEESEENAFDMILMDIRMPNMDGLETTRQIRKLDRKDAKTIPILAVSANAFEEDIIRSQEAGMNEHLSKPVDARVIYQKICEYCKRSSRTE